LSISVVFRRAEGRKRKRKRKRKERETIHILFD